MEKLKILRRKKVMPQTDVIDPIPTPKEPSLMGVSKVKDVGDDIETSKIEGQTLANDIEIANEKKIKAARLKLAQMILDSAGAAGSVSGQSGPATSSDPFIGPGKDPSLIANPNEDDAVIQPNLNDELGQSPAPGFGVNTPGVEGLGSSMKTDIVDPSSVGHHPTIIDYGNGRDDKKDDGKGIGAADDGKGIGGGRRRGPKEYRTEYHDDLQGFGYFWKP